MNRKIIKLVVRQCIDNVTQPDMLGRYSDKPGAPDKTVDREALKGKMTHELRYFIATNSPKETGNPNSLMQDYERMEDYEAGAWEYICIRAEAQVQLTENGPIQTIVSQGCVGIGSDSKDSKWFEDVIAEEKGQVIKDLYSIGFRYGEDGFDIPWVMEVEK